MSTPITEHPNTDASREKLPPVERDASATEMAHAPEAGSPKPKTERHHYSEHPKQTQPTEREVAIGKWAYKHRAAAEGLGGFLGYQIIRNSLAAIPYGVATAATWMGLEKVAKIAEAKRPDSFIAKAARSPIRDVAMIGAGFTLFRGTLKVVRYMKERLFDPQNTEAESIAEVQNFGTNLKETLKEVSPAEVASTPVAAFALGYGRRFWNPKTHLAPLGADAPKYEVKGLFGDGFKALKAADPNHTRWQHIKNVMTTRKGGLLPEMAIVAASFVPFFELGDRRYKDAQVARGIWLNDPSSLVRKSETQAKHELAQGEEMFANNKPTKYQDELVQKSYDSFKATGHLRPADAPTFSCFAMRRVVPTFMGIGAYVAGKRLAYMGMGTMTEHNKPGRHWLKNLAMMAAVEGAATSLFWINASVIDKFEPWYDKHFKDSKPKPLTDEEVRRHYAELKDRLDAKERERSGNQPTVA